MRAALAEQLGLALPDGPDAAGADAVVAFRVAPRRWWLVAGSRSEARRGRLPTRSPARAALTDLVHARTVLRLAGPASRSVLPKLCRIDLHPQALPPGRIAQTALGQVPALIHALDDQPGFDLYLPRSLARSAAISLIEAATEFGLTLGGRRD